MSFIKSTGDWIGGNPGKAAGALIGFLFGILLFTIGVVKTLLIVIFITVGFLIGKSRDDDTSIMDTISGIFKRRD
jgi:uncharacterized membrane protein